jgi:hypothetical protein
LPKQKAEVFEIQVEDVDSQQLPCLALKKVPEDCDEKDRLGLYMIATFVRKQKDHASSEFLLAFDSKFFLDKIAPLYLMSVPTERLVSSVIGFKPGFEF